MTALVRRSVVLAVAATLFGGLAGSAHAQEEMTGVRAMGMGQAFTGGPSGSGSLFFNPAGVSSLMMYSVETSYVYDQLTGRNLLHASIVDGKSNPRLGAGLGYTYGTSPEHATLAGFRSHDLYGALSAPIVPQWFIVGVGVHYLNYDQLGQDLAKGLTVDIGALLALGDFISVGVAARNLADIENSGRRREARFGLAYHASRVQLGFDTRVEFTTAAPMVSYMTGLELMVIDRLPMRLGYQYDGELDHNVISSGLGWRSEMVGVDALYHQDINLTQSRMFGLAINLYL